MIKRRVITFILVILSLLLQTTTLQVLKLADVVPNLLLIITVCYAYIRGRTSGLLIGFFCGLLCDMMYGTVIGLLAFILMAIGFICGHCQKIYFTDNYILPCVLVGISDFVYGFYYYITNFLVRGKLNFGFFFSTRILPETIYTILVSVLVFRLINYLEKFCKEKRKEA